MIEFYSVPLVSCVMPTANRGRFIPQALRCFLRQTYPNRELLVVDDGEPTIEHLCRDLPGVRYLRLGQPASTGVKLNLAMDAARGDIFQILDDDDFYHSDFLSSSVARISASDPGTLVTRCCFLILLRGDPVVRHSGHGWKPGGAFCFHREMWRKTPFRDVARSQDSWFLKDASPNLQRICRAEEYMVVRHGANTWNAMSTGDVDDYFRQCAGYHRGLESLIPDEDLPFYRSIASNDIFQSPRP